MNTVSSLWRYQIIPETEAESLSTRWRCDMFRTRTGNSGFIGNDLCPRDLKVSFRCVEHTS